MAYNPCLAADSDIAGIGVRVSVYIQAFLNLLCTAIFSRDGHIGPDEAEVLIESSKNLSLTTCAIILAASIQAGSTGLSVYHALIVLNLCWVNAFSSSSHFVARFSVFSTDEIRDILRLRGSLTSSNTRQLLRKGFPASIWLVIVSYWGMCAFGLTLWDHLPTFGNEDQQRCTPQLYLPIFGRDVPVTAPSLRRGSIAAYALFLLPHTMAICFGAGGRIIHTLASILCQGLSRCFPSRFSNNISLASLKIHPVCGVTFMIILEVVFIVDTELMISWSTDIVEEGEDTWTFGQTLAMVLVVVPLIHTVKTIWMLWNSRAPWPTYDEEGQVRNQNKDETHVEIRSPS